MTDLPLKDRIALVVGASRGIGYESALALAKAGAHVIATARTVGGLEELDDAIFAATGKHATLIPFDLVDGGAIDRLGGAIYERFGRLDIWVQAAATMGASGLTPVSHADPRIWAKVEKTNFTAVYRLIRSLEPLLKASDAGRVIHVTTSVAAAPKAKPAQNPGAGCHRLKLTPGSSEPTPVRPDGVSDGTAALPPSSVTRLQMASTSSTRKYRFENCAARSTLVKPKGGSLSATWA